MTLQVPDSVARSLRLPESEVEDRLRCELALALFRHYGSEELAEDLAYGRGE